jgi:CHAT domain-containing protein/predicted negative regulator of RcsB-dependent stress response
VNEELSLTEAIDDCFDLSFKILADHLLAQSVTTAALRALPTFHTRQKKRTYYEWKSTKPREVVVLPKPFLLQSIVLYETTKWEIKQERELRRDGQFIHERTLLLRYIKHLVQLSLSRSFYLAVSMCRVLHTYSHSETKLIYESLLQGVMLEEKGEEDLRYKADDAYRHWKMELRGKLKERFKGLLSERVTAHGEERFVAYDDVNALAPYAQKCLELLTPWKTEHVLPDGWPKECADIPAFKFERGYRDAEHLYEVNRMHGIIDPSCFSRYTQGLGCPVPEERLELPCFSMPSDKDGAMKSPIDLDHSVKPDGEAIRAILQGLTVESLKRRNSFAPTLSVVVDDIEVKRFSPREAKAARLSLEPGAKLLKVFATMENEEVLLSTLLISYSNAKDGEPWESSLTLEGKQEVSLSIVPELNVGGVVTQLIVDVSYREKSPVKAARLWYLRCKNKAADSNMGGILTPLWRGSFSVVILAVIISVIAHHYSEIRNGRHGEVVHEGLGQPVSKQASSKGIFERVEQKIEQAITGTVKRASNVRVRARIKSAPQSQGWLVALERAFGLEHSKAALRLIKLAKLHEDRRDYEKAEILYQRALTIQEKEHGDDYGDLATIRSNLASLYLDMGEQQKALTNYTQALLLFRSIQDRGGAAIILNNIGMVYDDLGERQKAVDYYMQALPLARAVRDRSGEAVTLSNIAYLERDRGDLHSALTNIEAALAITESSQAGNARQTGRASYFATVEDYYKIYIDLLMRLNKQQPVAGYNVMALEANERLRARSLLTMLAEAGVNIRQGVDPQQVERERALQRQLNASMRQQVRLLSSQHNKEQSAALAEEINKLTINYQQVQQQLRVSSPRYAALVQPASLTLGQIQREVLDPDTLLLEYVLGDERSFGWAVTPSSIKSFELPPRAEVESAVLRVYELLTARNQQVKGETQLNLQARIHQADTDYVAASAVLSRMLLAPVTDELEQKRLLIVADGMLQYVPFSALPVPQPSSDFVPLLAKHEIISLPSASVLALMRAELRGRKPAPKDVIVFADPVYELSDERLRRRRRLSQAAGEVMTANTWIDQTDTSERKSNSVAGGTSWWDWRGVSGPGDFARIKRLQFSQREAEAIMASVPKGGGSLVLGFSANRTTATGPELSQYRMVHFATHGLLNGSRPELSGLALSRFDHTGKRENGFLQLEDIYNLNLPADLVVLSACQTALDKDVQSEGLSGLTRGFMYAGAARVIASLWKSDDAATANLMGEFYRAMLREGLSPAAALRSTQVHMWQQSQWRAPYYWAAFTLQGEWR